ncbi:MAG: winged helix-turn-helix domain-containing protein, partial [Actinomycetota bacterium]|nr:winged helix-turn-helix domain-containing protein [Actinomycetota bacterium]
RAGPRDGEGTASLSASRTVLVVTPESTKAGEVVGALQDRGVPSIQASTPSQAIFWARRARPALVVLDTNVRGAGLLLGEFRGEGRLLVALNDDDSERVRALEAGCVDALPKSLEPDELALKVTRLARSDGLRAGGTIVAGPLTVDLPASRLLWRDKELSASPLLLNLAGYLASRPGRLTPARALLEDVWGEPWADPNKVHQAMYRLRRSLGVPANSPFLVARRGHGYGVFPQTFEAQRHQSAGAVSR